MSNYFEAHNAFFVTGIRQMFDDSEIREHYKNNGAEMIDSLEDELATLSDGEMAEWWAMSDAGFMFTVKIHRDLITSETNGIAIDMEE